MTAFLGWRAAGDREFAELDEFLLARAMEHDSPTLLFRLACEQLRSSRVIRPGPDVLSRRVGAARERAKVETYVRVEPVLTRDPRLPSELDGLLEVDPKLGSPRLTWLGRGPTRSSPSAIKAELEKHAFLSGRRRLRPRPVDAASGAAPVPGHDRTAIDCSGAGASGS